MFIPGLPSSAAQPVTVLTNLANAGSATGSFRTNIGVYNPNLTAVVATIRLYEFEGSFPPVLLGVMPLNLGPQSGTQVSNIYKGLGFETLQTTSGYATVESGDVSKPLFTYAATADNTTQDPILVVGAADVAAPAGFHPPTPTAGAANPTPTPTVAAPTPTPTSSAPVVVNLVATEFQWSFNGSGNIFTLHVGQAYELHISDADRAGSPSHGFSGIPALGLSRHTLTAGGPPIVETITPTPGQVGVFGFACDQSSCGVGHSSMTAAIEIVP
jgi:heme/copper-type cytochrome/quinol oxidase subunit 2